MPTLPLPYGPSLSGGEVPVSGPEDVLAEFSTPQRNAETAPVRDAFCEAFSDAFVEYQNEAADAAAQCDPLRATGDYLLDIAEERDTPVGRGETDEEIRARIFETPSIVTPDAIIEAVNAILARVSTKTCTASELNLDGWFVNNGSSVWHSFVGANPEYPDRYYEDLPQQLPGGAVPSSGLPRSFFLRIPTLEGASNQFTWVTNDATNMSFVGDGSDTAGSESSGDIGYFVFANPQTADDLYATIVAVVTAKKGQGVTWSLLVDDRL